VKCSGSRCSDDGSLAAWLHDPAARLLNNRCVGESLDCVDLAHRLELIGKPRVDAMTDEVVQIRKMMVAYRSLGSGATAMNRHCWR
jgi:hypothetical protein